MSLDKARVREILSDPLSDISRKERRNLLTASVVGVVVEWTGLIPSQVTTLGIEITLVEQRYFLVLLVAIIVYFLIAFAIYGIADYFIWREAYRSYEVKIEIEIENVTYDDEANPYAPEERVPYIPWVYGWSKPLAKIRQLFEYVVPVVIGLFASAALLITAFSHLSS